MQRTSIVLAALASVSALASAQFGTNLLLNNTFESGSTFLGRPNNWERLNNTAGGWTTAFNRTPGGLRSLSVPAVNGFQAWRTIAADRPTFIEVPPVANGGPLTFSVWYLMPGEVNAAVVGASIQWFSATGTGLGATGDLPITDRNTNSEWRQYSVELTPPQGATRANVQLFCFNPDMADPPASGIVYFDDVSLVQAPGATACSPLDFAEPFAVLDSADLLIAIDRVADDETLFDASENRVGNPSFEISADPDDTPDNGPIPEGWFDFGYDPGTAFYETSNQNGAPAARTGTRFVRAGDDGEPGGFHGWTTQPVNATEFNLDSPLVFEGYFNVPQSINAAVVGVKLEFLDVNPNGTYGAFLGTTGDLIISNGSPTNGWELFRFTRQPNTLVAGADVVRPLIFLFSPDGTPITGNIYFDDIFIGQQDIARGDFDNSGTTDFFDVLEAVSQIEAGCP